VRVLVTEKLSEQGLELLRRDFQVDVRLELATGALVQEIGPYEALIVRSQTRVTSEVLDAAEHLRVVARAGIGLDNVDVDAATRRGVMVVNAPQSNVISAAEHSLALMLAQARSVPQADAALKAGKWERTAWEGVELAGKTLGIVGVGNVGRRVARFAGAIGMRVLGYDKYVPAEEVRRRGAEPVGSLEELLPQVDVLTCHTPLTPETRHMIDERALSRLRPGAIFINTSRGPVHSERAVFEALVQKRLGAAGLDVFEQEPSPVDNPIFNLDNVVCSGHVAGVTLEANREASLQVTAEILRVLRGERPRDLANPEVWPRPAHRR